MASRRLRRVDLPDLSLTVFAGAAAVVAVHAVVDSFIAPEPGTGAGDHLSRGLVTLGLLTVAVVAFARLPAGGRAALAAVLGGLALEGFALAVADASGVGARGEDWSGFLLLPVGLALLALALVLLLRSRKPGRLRWLRRIGIAATCAVCVYWLVVPVAAAIFATHRPRAAVYPVQLGRPYQAVTLLASDGLRLAGWYVRSRNGAAVISYPTRQGKLPQARMLIDHGYGVLLLDARGYDGSQGDPNMFGWDDAKDIDAAVAWLQRQPDVRDGRIGGIGFSVGGEMMLDAAARNTGLRAVVSEGAGVRSVREDLLRGPGGWFALPEAALQTAALTIMSGTLPPASLRDLVREIAPRAVLLIYAADGAGGEELNRSYFRAAHEPKAIWRVSSGGHTGGMEAQPRAYERRVVGFFDRFLVTTHRGGSAPDLTGQATRTAVE